MNEPKPNPLAGSGVTTIPCIRALLERGEEITPGQPSPIVKKLLGTEVEQSLVAAPSGKLEDTTNE